jgi:hypothetical protein
MAVPPPIVYIDGDGLRKTGNAPLLPGRAIAAESRPVALSNEDAAFLDGIEGKLDSLITQGASTTDVGVEVHQPGDVITVTPTLDTSIYASGDVLFTTTAIANAVRANDGIALLQSIIITDKDDQKPEIALKFWSSNVTYGAFNGAPSITDADAANCLGRVNIVTADYDDDGGVSTAFKDNIGKMLKAASGTRTIYITGKLTSGTPTHTASGLVIRLALLWG